MTRGAPDALIALARRAAGVAAVVAVVAGCGGGDDAPSSGGGTTTATSATTAPAPEDLDRVVKIESDRGLYVRCTGTGSPTVIMEGGDEDTSDSYAFAEPTISRLTRTCVYDRANLGQSDPARGPRGLSELVGDLERLVQVAKIPPPYVLVGTSGGGYITAGFAEAHPQQIAGLVFIDTAAPFRNPPQEIVEATDPSNPQNIEKRDYLQVEKDAWAARERIGDIPLTIVTAKPSAEAIKESPFPSERRPIQNNVTRQKGWLVLSPRAEQILADTGHAVEEEDPEFVTDAILDAVKEAR